jgi:quercetin dioxygenase-like cupin family protein
MRVTETPNAIMTTLASPSLGSAELSLWQVSMAAGQRGPLHAFDAEQIWHVLAGAVDVSGRELAAGDTLVLPAGELRRITALSDARIVVCGRGDAVVRVAGEPEPRGVPPWIA